MFSSPPKDSQGFCKLLASVAGGVSPIFTKGSIKAPKQNVMMNLAQVLAFKELTVYFGVGGRKVTSTWTEAKREIQLPAYVSSEEKHCFQLGIRYQGKLNKIHDIDEWQVKLTEAEIGDSCRRGRKLQVCSANLPENEPK